MGNWEFEQQQVNRAERLHGYVFLSQQIKE
jgi:hypothetical protein